MNLVKFTLDRPGQTEPNAEIILLCEQIVGFEPRQKKTLVYTTCPDQPSFFVKGAVEQVVEHYVLAFGDKKSVGKIVKN